MKRFSHISLFVGLALCVLASERTVCAQAPSAGAQEKHPPLPKPSNLKILPKDIESGDLIELMRGYAQQLGVRCEFCHVENADTHRIIFADDAKPEKNTARIMITMTNEINSKYLSQLKDSELKDSYGAPKVEQVTCATCHRGHAQPEAFTPPAHPQDQQRPDPAQPSGAARKPPPD